MEPASDPSTSERRATHCGLTHFGYSLEAVREWRARQNSADLPDSLNDFLAAHGLCVECRAEGVILTEWVRPSSEEGVRAAAELKLDRLPLYSSCGACGGTGRRPGGL